jgi:hypothetical protein
MDTTPLAAMVATRLTARSARSHPPEQRGAEAAGEAFSPEHDQLYRTVLARIAPYPAARRALELLEDAPTDERRQEAMLRLLIRLIEADAGFANLLQQQAEAPDDCGNSRCDHSVIIPGRSAVGESLLPAMLGL